MWFGFVVSAQLPRPLRPIVWVRWIKKKQGRGLLEGDLVGADVLHFDDMDALLCTWYVVSLLGTVNGLGFSLSACMSVAGLNRNAEYDIVIGLVHSL